MSRRTPSVRSAATGRTVATAAAGVVLALAVVGALLVSGAGRHHRAGPLGGLLDGASPYRGHAVRSTADDGVPTVGTFLTRQSTGWNGRSCNGTVVPSPGRDLIVTAAHCIAGYDGVHGMVFAPQWHDGKAPFGTFPFLPGKVWTDPAYVRGRSGYTAERWDLDVAFVRLGRNARGQRVQDAVGGANPVSFHAPPSNTTMMIGYPARLRKPIHCQAASGPAFGSYQQIACKGFTGGTSGAPWFTGWNPRTRTGTLIGVLGGYQRGGFSDDLEYGVRFGPAVRALYEQAAAGRPQRSAGGMGGPSRWRGAAGTAAGRFFGGGSGGRADDLMVRFRDGSVRLYQGNGGGGFRRSVRMRGAAAVWRDVRAFTVGDFGGGGGRSDVLAVRRDGAVLLYRDVRAGAGSLGRPVRLRGPDAAWAGVRAVAAGPYGGSTRRCDALVVVGRSGRVVLHTGVGRVPGALGRGRPLGGPSAVWRGVRTLSMANMTPNGTVRTSGRADLLALFGDGAVRSYPDLTARRGALDRPVVLAPAGRERAGMTTLAAGRWIDLKPGGPIPDDVLIGWRNGALMMHQNVNLHGFVREFPLVAPEKPGGFAPPSAGPDRAARGPVRE